MLMFSFFVTVFSSVCWLIYAIMFVNSKLLDSGLWEQSFSDMIILLAIVFLPILVIWMIFGYINQFFANKMMNTKQNELLRQLQKNQDYTDLVVRVMLDAEHEIKDGFVINKFDMFIADMNESLGEIIQRCNIASSAQLEQLWQRVRRGERWTLGKAILDASKSQSTFNAWVQEKVNRDNVFRGTLMEFCFRYQNLLQLLEKHDRDRIFLRIIETGVFGKVYSIIAPLSDGIRDIDSKIAQSSDKKESNRDYASVLKIATMEEPSATETIMNVDKDDIDDVPVIEKKSFFSKLNPFKSKREETFDDDIDQDPFFKALQNSFRGNEDSDSDFVEPKMSENVESALEPKFERDYSDFKNINETLNTIKEENSEDNIISINADEKEKFSLTGTDNILTEKQGDEFNKRNEDFVYPFGGWTDEENYSK